MVFKGIQVYSRVNRGSQGYIGVFKGKQGYTRVNRGM